MTETQAQMHSFPRLGVEVSEQLFLLLHKYLRTYSRQAESQAEFLVPRCADADTLLCRLAMDGEDVAEELLAAMTKLFGGEAFDEGELSTRWEQRTATSIDQLDQLEDRVITYVRGYWKEACQQYGFADVEKTEPPAGWREGTMVAAGDGDVKPVAIHRGEQGEQRYLDWVYFERRLDEEASRGGRGLGPFSMLFVDLPADLAVDEGLTALVTSRLRPYDVACTIGDNQVGVILPGIQAEACMSVVVRLRRTFEETFDVEVPVGVATWPDDGVSARALLEHATEAVWRDRRRIEQGEVEFDTIPPYMVDESSGEIGKPSKVWLEGMPQAIAVQAVATDGGVRLRARLPFLRTGSSVQFTDRGRVFNGTVKGAFVGPSPDKGPVLQLEVVPPYSDS